MLAGFGGDHRAAPRPWHRRPAPPPGRRAAEAAPEPALGIECYHVNARLSQKLEDIGDFRIGKFLLLLGYSAQAILVPLSIRGDHSLDDRPGKRSPARLGPVAVEAAEVSAVGARLKRDVDAVVHDEDGPVPAAYAGRGRRLRQPRRARRALHPELDPARPGRAEARGLLGVGEPGPVLGEAHHGKRLRGSSGMARTLQSRRLAQDPGKGPSGIGIVPDRAEDRGAVEAELGAAREPLGRYPADREHAGRDPAAGAPRGPSA